MFIFFLWLWIIREGFVLIGYFLIITKSSNINYICQSAHCRFWDGERDHLAWSSHVQLRVRWSWPLIGGEWSHDLDTGLSLGPAFSVRWHREVMWSQNIDIHCIGCQSSILASDWSRKIVWPKCWPLIGCPSSAVFYEGTRILTYWRGLSPFRMRWK